MKLRTRSVLLVVLIPIILIAATNGYKLIHKKIEQKMYPLPQEYLSCIEKYSDEYSIPIDLICAVINTESSFNPSAISHAKAYGMMQITEETFNWLQYRMGIDGTLSKENLFDYETNIKFGTYFLSILYDEFQNYDTVLAAYNAGRGSVLNWLQDPAITENGELINIPFEETTEYIQKVNNARAKYTELYFSDNTTELN